ncbi:MAG: hypothetical protein U0457_09935 [Candidatus Sericytochromatia bacterium]
MKNIIRFTLTITIIFSFCLNKNAYAVNYTDTQKDVIKLDFKESNQFLINDGKQLQLTNYTLIHDNNDIDELEEPIHPNWVTLNLLLPGLGNLVVGEFIGGTLLFILSLASIFTAFFLELSSPSSNSDMGNGKGWVFLIIFIPSYLIIYIINLFVTNSTYSELSKKYKKYLKNKLKQKNSTSSSNIFSYNINF